MLSNQTLTSKWPQKIATQLRKLKLKAFAFITLLFLSLSVSAHVFEIRYTQAPNGSITWYLISYHGTEQCPAEAAGLNINGTNYPISIVTLGDARPLSPNIFAQDLGCYARLNPNAPPVAVNDLYVSYGIVNTPFIGGSLTIAPYSNAVCFAFCVGGTVVFNPPPIVNCPANVSQTADAGVCNAAVTVPAPTVIDNCTYSGTNPEMVTNGDFNAGPANWNNCGNLVEAFCSETCYGGPNGANRVAEIDHQPVTLCQNISGFVVGKTYELTFKASRRQGGTPATVGAVVMINGGAFNTTVNRTNTTWGFTTETFTFIATQTTHQLTMVPTAGWGGTLGFIVDDISIKKKLGTITNDFNNTSDASGTYPVGVTNVVWTITHCDGSTATCNQTVTVTDDQDPLINLQDQFRCYEADNNGCAVNLGVTATDNCAVLSLTSDAPACFPVGTTTVTWTATDVNGNTSTATQQVTRNPEIDVSICAGPTDIIYTGTVDGYGPFGPTTVTLTSSASGGTPGYTYSWAPGGQTTADITVSPIVTTTYTLTVTDSKGCTRSLSKTIQVLPLSAAQCNTNGKAKFSVCHVPPGNPANAHNICISPNALNAHLTSGSNGHNNCYLGPCRDFCVSTSTSQRLVSKGSAADYVEREDRADVKELTVTASPNPSTADFVIQIESADKQTPITIRVVDELGRPTQLFSKVAVGSVVRFGNTYHSGIYIVEVMQGNQRRMIKLMKL